MLGSRLEYERKAHFGDRLAPDIVILVEECSVECCVVADGREEALSTGVAGN